MPGFRDFEDFVEEFKAASVRGLAPGIVAPPVASDRGVMASGLLPVGVVPPVPPQSPGLLATVGTALAPLAPLVAPAIVAGVGGLIGAGLASMSGDNFTPGMLVGGPEEALDESGFVTPFGTTTGTGFIAPSTGRAWDPIQQRFYQTEGRQAGAGRTLSAGATIPGRGVITKSWFTSAARRDGSIATTQMAMTSDGRMVSLSESGVMKTWRPYRSIVIGKSLTTQNVRRVATRVKSHVKGLKKVLSVLK